MGGGGGRGAPTRSYLVQQGLGALTPPFQDRELNLNVTPAYLLVADNGVFTSYKIQLLENNRKISGI